jgi:hypothetical protein
MGAFNPAKIGRTSHAQGIFSPKYPQKYMGDLTHLIYRSSWERDLYITCDENPAVMQWMAEPFSIPYIDPLTGQKRNYWPDALVCYMQKDGTIKRELIEIKPLKETIIEKAKAKRDKLNLLVNQAKWAAASIFCKNNGIGFRVLTERELYGKKI